MKNLAAGALLPMCTESGAGGVPLDRPHVSFPNSAHPAPAGWALSFQAKHGPKAGTVWTDEDVAELMRWHARGLVDRTIGKKLGRGTDAIRKKRAELSLPQNHGVKVERRPPIILPESIGDPEEIDAETVKRYRAERCPEAETLDDINAFRVAQGLCPWKLRRRAQT